MKYWFVRGLVIIAVGFLAGSFPKAHGQVTPSPSSGQSAAAAKSTGGAENTQTRDWLAQAKDVADVAQSVFTVLGIVVGGVWTYLLFVKRRQRYPRAKVGHKITHKRLPGDRHLLHVVTEVSNTGEVLLTLGSGLTRVQQVLPPPSDLVKVVRNGKDPVGPADTEYPWPCVGERLRDWTNDPREVEPGETDEIHWDFIVEPDAQTLEIYSYFKNVTKEGREIGWNLTTMYDL
jgi:hypothetical protein